MLDNNDLTRMNKIFFKKNTPDDPDLLKKYDRSTGVDLHLSEMDGDRWISCER